MCFSRLRNDLLCVECDVKAYQLNWTKDCCHSVEQNFVRPCARPSCRWCHVTETVTRTRVTRDAVFCHCPSIFTSTTLPPSASVHRITPSLRHWSSLVSFCASKEYQNAHKATFSPFVYQCVNQWWAAVN